MSNDLISAVCSADVIQWLGPTCKKMMDLTSPDKVFKASAFQPTDEDLDDHKRGEKEKRNAKGKPKAPPSNYVIPDVLSDSDSDDLPEVSDIFNYRKKAKIEPNSDDVRLFFCSFP